MTTVGLVVLVLFLFAFLVVFLKFAKLIQSVLAGANVGLFDMLAMSLRMIVEGRINLVQARIDGIQSNDLEAHYLAGGNVPRVVKIIPRTGEPRSRLPDRHGHRPRWPRRPDAVRPASLRR